MQLSEKLKNLFPQAHEIPAEHDLVEPLHQREYLLDGNILHWQGAMQEVKSPILVGTEGGELQARLIGSYPLVGEKEALEALDSAVTAYDNGRGKWPTMTVAQRIECVENFTKMMIINRSKVVKLLMWEIAKSLPDAEKEFDRTVDYIYQTIDALKDLDRSSSRFEITQGIIGQTRRSPLGVVLCMGPFNYPLNETFTMFIPALIMGNVVLFKPPRQGVLLHSAFLEGFQKCFPKGVINTVYGRGSVVVPPLMASGKVDVLTLIGSSRMADKIQKMHPKINRLRSVLGLDAKNMGIVLSNADIDATVKECVLGSFSFNGQRCTALKILFVHKSVVNNFLEKFNAAVDQLKLGMPWEKGVQITPVAEPEKPAYIADVINDAVSKGAKIVNTEGGQNWCSMVYPTVVYPVRPNMRLYEEEQFGPIIPVVVFDELNEPIEYLIKSSHGQQVSIFGTDANQIAHLLDHLVNQVSRVNVNAQCQRGPDTFPFTGRKDSAQGTLSVFDALRSFSIRTVVATKQTAQNVQLFNEIADEHLSNFLSTRFIF
jgi:acyl-CoA reductase-like NAD-dependent aldehyde dehydrogenase